MTNDNLPPQFSTFTSSQVLDSYPIPILHTYTYLPNSSHISTLMPTPQFSTLIPTLILHFYTYPPLIFHIYTYPLFSTLIPILTLHPYTYLFILHTYSHPDSPHLYLPPNSPVSIANIYRGYFFHLALFHLELLQTETVFWGFLFKSMWGEMIRWWRGYSYSRKAGRDHKSNVSGFIKDLQHHIIVNIFPWNNICQNPFHPNTSQLFIISSLKSIPTFKTKKSLKK